MLRFLAATTNLCWGEILLTFVKPSGLTRVISGYMLE